MAIVIDVDAHFEPGPEWLAARPDLAARLPAIDYGATAARAMCGDLLDSMPAEQRPPITDMYPPGLLDLFAQEKQDESERRAEFEDKNMVEVAKAKARL